jgi:hypothetical protein
VVTPGVAVTPVSTLPTGSQAANTAATTIATPPGTSLPTGTPSVTNNYYGSPTPPDTSLTGTNGTALMLGQTAQGYAQGQAQQAGYENQQQMLAAQIAQQNNFSAARQYNPLLSATNK